ncbi:MAG: hypothetical protein WBD96_01720, partial [Pseudolabrys sp.]
MIDQLVDRRSADQLRDRNQYTKFILQVVRERHRPQRIQTNFIQRLIRIYRLHEAKLRHRALLQSVQKLLTCLVIHHHGRCSRSDLSL